MEKQLGFANFLQNVDGVGLFLLVVLMVMSVATWYLIIIKAWQNQRMRRHARAFLSYFWDAPDLGSVAEWLKKTPPRDPFSHLAHHGFRAIAQHEGKTSQRLIEVGSQEEFLTRALRRAIEQDTARLENGLTVLASVGSSAPFVGLFGTVWGVYHALVSIGMSGQGTLDKVAGPVGEALIMTALGLAVAIPAVLAYNFFTRTNRVVLAELDGFAHDLFAFMSTGNRVEAPVAGGNVTPLNRNRGA
ncbi:MAG: MotA/TolQ/ExbB proton channel family protein [Methylophilaceae bacterium]|nr:MotA/TolQ/ExbB proton channel family protein [Methylophilaceae bacterium]